MVLYDFLAPAYDPVLKPIYAPFRRRAFEALDLAPGAAVLDLACGTGQNFSYLRVEMEGYGKIVGVDISKGMLKKAELAAQRQGRVQVWLLKMDAAQLTSTLLEQTVGQAEVDAVVCTYGFTAMKNWKEVFQRSFELLKPGGAYFIHDIHAEVRTRRVKAFEIATQVDLTRKSWEPLQELCVDFHFEYLDPSAHIFAGRLFVARGIKPASSPTR